MENRNFYPWFTKLTFSLSVYFNYVQRLNAIATENRVPHKKRISDIQFLLINFSDSLAEAEQNFLNCTQFPPTNTGKCYKGKVAHNVMGMEFSYFVN